MTVIEIEKVLTLRGCAIVAAGAAFGLTHPVGLEPGTRTRELFATSREGAVREAWLWLHPEGNARQSITIIQHLVAQDYQLPAVALVNRDRSEPLATARRVAMALARELTLSSHVNIGAAFDRDGGTVLHACDSVRNQCATDKQFAARVGALRVACSVAMRADQEDAP